MELKYDVEGRKRKQMAVAMGKILETDLVYMRTPSYAFKVGDCTIDRYGVLTGPDTPLTQRLVQALALAGFVARQHEAFAVEIPRAGFTDSALSKLKQLVESKSTLIRHALDTQNLTIEVTDDVIRFPWFAKRGEDAHAAAYTLFISALCKIVKNDLRIRTQQKDIDNEKYAFRCFLLRLGFIGPQFKTLRKLLLRNLTGSSAFLSEESKQKAFFKRKERRLHT